MKYVSLILLLFASFSLQAQSGNYFLSHYSPGKDRFDNVCFDMVQAGNGVMYFATQSGVMQFDGLNWNLIPGTGAVYSLQVHEDVIYWAGTSGYGTIDDDTNSFPQIITLSKGVKDVFQTIAVKDRTCFVNESSLYILTRGQQKETVIRRTDATGSFTNIFELFGMVFVTTELGGILKIQNNQLVPSGLGLPTDAPVIFAHHFENRYLLGLADNRLYIVGENLKPRQLKLEDEAYANASVLVSARWVNQDMFALGTLRGGLMFVHATTGRTQEIINYTTGLPDDEVFALMSDKNQCIWAAHEYGFTRVAPYLPFRSFGHYPGLQGNLLCVLSRDADVYVGTSLGLYKLEKEDVYDEKVYYVESASAPQKQPIHNAPAKRTDPVKTSASTETKPAATTEAQTETATKNQGFFKFLRKKKARQNGSSNESTPAPIESVPEDAPAEATKSMPVTAGSAGAKQKRTQRVLRSSQYVYKKVNGIGAKITHLLNVEGNVVAAGLGGAYEVDGLQATPLATEPIRFAFASNEGLLFLATYDDKVQTLQYAMDRWQNLTILDGLHDQINYMFQGVGKEVWLCALDNIYRVDVTSVAAPEIETLTINNPNFEDYVGVASSRQVLLANSHGFLKYDRVKRAFEALDTLKRKEAISYFADGGHVWYRDIHNWKWLGQTPKESNLHLLNLFRNLRFIRSDENPENLWIITGNNELYKFYGDRFIPYDRGYPIILKSVRNGETRVADRHELVFEQDQSSLVFEIVQPDYLASKSIEYRYQVKGLDDDDWTEWSSANSTVNFPYLPAGDYQLVVQARDIFGKVQDLDAVSFEILPPYWQRPWFYLLEVLFFASLVVLSVRLSTRYRFVSRILTLLTIIMLIQLIEVLVGDAIGSKDSPVIDFFAQVFVAFLVLPLEGFLRNFMLRSLDSPNRLHRFINRISNTAEQQQEP